MVDSLGNMANRQRIRHEGRAARGLGSIGDCREIPGFAKELAPFWERFPRVSHWLA